MLNERISEVLASLAQTEEKFGSDLEKLQETNLLESKGLNEKVAELINLSAEQLTKSFKQNIIDV